MKESKEIRLRIKDYPENQRPYERLEKFGAKALSDAELMAIIIKTGTKQQTSLEVANMILKLDEQKEGLSFLNHLSLQELCSVKGIGRVKALQIMTVIELSKRICSGAKNSKVIISSPGDISRCFLPEMQFLKQEEIRVALLNVKNVILKVCTLAVGGLNQASIEAREVYKEPIKAGAASIILVHNHPSGDPKPSKEDLVFTKRIMQSGEMLGIKLLDHVVIGAGNYISMKEQGLI